MLPEGFFLARWPLQLPFADFPGGVSGGTFSQDDDGFGPVPAGIRGTGSSRRAGNLPIPRARSGAGFGPKPGAHGFSAVGMSCLGKISGLDIDDGRIWVAAGLLLTGPFKRDPIVVRLTCLTFRLMFFYFFCVGDFFFGPLGVDSGPRGGAYEGILDPPKS